MRTPKEIVEELMARDEPTFHNVRVKNFFDALAAAGYVIVPKEPTEAMIDAGCECDAYSIAVHENKKRHEELMAKYPRKA